MEDLGKYTFAYLTVHDYFCYLHRVLENRHCPIRSNLVNFVSAWEENWAVLLVIPPNYLSSNPQKNPLYIVCNHNFFNLYRISKVSTLLSLH